MLLEHGGSGLYQPIDLDIARCRMSVAVPAGFDYASAVRQGARLRVATKYTRTAREHFAAKGVHVDLIKLYGSMELAPLVGLADAIVDLVCSGNTLRANNLVEVEEIMQISSRLVVNQAALKLKRERAAADLDAFERASQWCGSQGERPQHERSTIRKLDSHRRRLPRSRCMRCSRSRRARRSNRALGRRRFWPT